MNDLRIVLVQCTNSKRDGTHPARDLYDESDYFVKQRAYARQAEGWFIQSAEYGLLAPGDEIESYDAHANDLDDPEAWGEEIAADLAARVPTDATVEILGGAAYADPLTPALEKRGFEVKEPLRGQGIGTRKRSLMDMANRTLGGYA
jgi:hypothetical protein